MDVTCERCGTEYEFDATLLSGRGTSVKCTNCGHVFKVYPRAEAAADRTTSVWRLRTGDGSTDTIDSLRELQRRIAAGELTPDDEISRADEGWKTLGSIPELETFFRAAGVQVPAGRIPSPLPPTPAALRGSRDSSLPPGRRPRQPTLLGVVVPPSAAKPPEEGPVAERTSPGTVPAPAAAPAPSEPLPAAAKVPEPLWEPAPGPKAVSEASRVPETASAAASASEPAPEPSRPSAAEPVSEPVSQPPFSAAAVPSSRPPAAQIEDAEFSDVPPAPSRSSTRPSTPPPSYYDDDDDIPELPSRGGSPLRWLLVIVIVGGLALVASQWDRITHLIGVGSDPALIAAAITEGDAAVEEGHPDAFASAIAAYRRAIESGGRDAETLAKLSRSHALAAQAQIDDGGTPGGAEPHVAAAAAAAEDALAADPGGVEAKVAKADAMRLAGDLDEARALLDEVRSMHFSRTAERFRIDARLRAAEAGTGLESGLRSAKQAVALAPKDVNYLLLLARAEMAAGDQAAARAALDIVLDDHPAHPVASRLVSQLDAKPAAQGQATATEETATADDTAAGADAGTQEESETESEADSTEDTEVESAAPAEKPAGKRQKAAGSETVPTPGPSTGRGSPAPEATPSGGKRKRATEADEDEYDRLVEAASDDAFVDGRPPVRSYEWYMEQGRAELAAGNYSRARSFFDTALEARPGSAAAMDGLGTVFTRIEDFDTALRYYRVAAQRGHPDGFFNLGKTYETLGRNDEAVSAYYTYVKRRPDGRHVATAVSRIKTLEPRAKLPPQVEPDRAPAPAPENEPAPTPEAGSEPTAESEPSSP